MVYQKSADLVGRHYIRSLKWYFIRYKITGVVYMFGNDYGMEMIMQCYVEKAAEHIPA